MATTSLMKLEKEIKKLEDSNQRLRESNERLTKENYRLKREIKNLEENIESIVKKAIEKAYEPIMKELENVKKENENLKRILNHNSSNTGIPTSKTKIGEEKRIPNSREKSEKSKGGQVGHKKHKLEKFKDEEITDTYIYEVAKCKCGCEKLIDLGIKTTKDLFDIDIRLMKIRNEFHIYECSECGKKIESPIPSNLKEENQYGSKAQAMAISLVNEGYVSFKRTRELISGFTGQEMNMSEGFIAKLQKRCYEKLEEFDLELHRKILKQKILHWDDTTISINGKQSCLRFYGNELLRYYKAHERKNKEGLDKDGILSYLDKETVVIHDHNKVNYNEEYNFTNAECCVHLIRDLRELNEVLPRKWIEKLITLLKTTNDKRKEYINETIMYFDQEVSDKVIIEYDNIVNEAREINRTNFNKYYGNEEKKLIKRLIEYKDNYLLWVLRFDIPFSNNLSERSLRGSKTKMKVSGQFANIQNAEYFARIKSYIETCKCNGLNPHIALVKLIEDNPYTIEDMKID